jgi:hypothetical protein
MNISWRLGVSGDFAVASNWNPAVIPGLVDDATISANGICTVTSSLDETAEDLNTPGPRTTVRTSR